MKPPEEAARAYDLAVFQSLKGFQRLWSLVETKSLAQASWSVSIPKRVSEALKLMSVWSQHLSFIVSIPKRVSEALKLTILQFNFLAKLFQSLKGFQRLWSIIKVIPVYRRKFVSIPKRVSEALKPSLGDRIERICFVSIPKRVSEALKPKTDARFWGYEKFQSLKGFQRLWSIKRLAAFQLYQVSIPKRVSEALKPQRVLSANAI